MRSKAELLGPRNPRRKTTKKAQKAVVRPLEWSTPAFRALSELLVRGFRGRALSGFLNLWHYLVRTTVNCTRPDTGSPPALQSMDACVPPGTEKRTYAVPP